MPETERLILRRWTESDAEDLYEYAKDPDVGPIAGWPAHQSVRESRDVIRNVLSGREAYAVCLKDDGRAIGAIELKLNGRTDMTERDDECEMGYWLGKPFWGRGIMPEAVREMLRHAFEDLGMRKVWIGYYEGNGKSKRVQEKCGFRFQWKSEGVDVPLMREKRTGYVSSITKEQWEQDRRNAAGDGVPEAEIFGENRFETYSKTREGSRAVILRDGRILLAHELNSGWWLVPGGGREGDETPEECCVREAEEETGYIVRPLRQFLTIYEYYEEYRYISRYFACEITGEGQMHLTDAEKSRGVRPEWIPLQEAVDIFSRHQSWADVSEEKRGSYLREYTALREYLKTQA